MKKISMIPDDSYLKIASYLKTLNSSPELSIKADTIKPQLEQIYQKLLQIQKQLEKGKRTEEKLYLAKQNFQVLSQVKSLKPEAFSDFPFLASAIFPDIESFKGDKTFYNCPNLSSFFAYNLKNINGSNTFSKCTFENLDLPNVTDIKGDNLCTNCNNLRNLNLSSLKSFSGKTLCKDCKNLSIVNLASYEGPITPETFINNVPNDKLITKSSRIEFPANWKDNFESTPYLDIILLNPKVVELINLFPMWNVTLIVPKHLVQEYKTLYDAENEYSDFYQKIRPF